MADKIKKEDLFDSQLFSDVLPGLEKYVQLLDKAEKEAVEFLKVQRDIANVRTFNDSASIDAQAKSEKVYTDVIKQGILLRKEKLDAEKKLVEIEIQKQKLADATDRAAKKAIDNTQNYTKRVRELTKELATIDPKKEAARYTAIAKEAGALKDKIGDARAAVKAFSSDSKATTAKTLFGQIITDLKDLNFADAADKARQLSAVIKSISFAEVVEGVKNFGVALAGIGKALLANPFTLVVAGLVAVGYALKEFVFTSEPAIVAAQDYGKALDGMKKSTEGLRTELEKTNIELLKQKGVLSESTAKGITTAIDLNNKLKELGQKKVDDDLAREEEFNKKIEELKNDGNKKQIAVEKDAFERANRESDKEYQKQIDLISKQIDEQAKIRKQEGTNKAEKEAEEAAKKRIEKERQEYYRRLNEWRKFQNDLAKVKFDEKSSADEDLEASEKKLRELNVDATKATIQNISDLQKQQLDDLKKANQMIEDNEKANAEKRKKRQKEIEDLTISQVEKSLDRQNALKSSALDQELQQRERNIQQQQSLAERGLDNQLAFEQAQLAKAELAKAELAKKEQRQKEALALMKLIADDGFVKGSIEFALAKAIAGSFKDGVEDLEGPGTETSDSILARLSKGESVATASATRENPGLVTAMNKGKVDEYFKNELLPGYMTETGINTGSFARNVANSAMIHELVSVKEEIKGLKQVIQARPVHQSEITKAGDVIETKIANGLRTVILHKTAKKPL